jgi:hypothetical protein
MNFHNELFFVGLIPLVVAAAAAFALRRMRAPTRVVWSVGVGLGFVAGQCLLASRPGLAWALRSVLEPREASEWLPHAVLLAMGVTVVAAYAPRSWQSGILGLAALVSIGTPARLLAGPMAQQWSTLEKLCHLALLGAVVSLAWLLLASARDDAQPRLRQFLSVLIVAVSAVVISLSGSFALGRLGGILAAALGGAALAAPRGLTGAAGVVAISFCSLIFLGVFYAQLTPVSCALLMVSMIVAAGRLPEAVFSWPRWQQNALRMALSLPLLAAALAASLA